MKNPSWKSKALKKQLQYKKQLGLTESDTYGKQGNVYLQILSDKDAAAGANFYCYGNPKEWSALQEWANLDKGKSMDFTGSGLKNMLRSEHIPFNFFFPLEQLRIQNRFLLCKFLNELFNNQIQIDKVLRIKIEFASDLPKQKLLDDNTSFDAYIEYRYGDKTGGLGIEVKYTEKSYPYGSTEKERMDDNKSRYNQLTRSSDYYKPDAWYLLKEKKTKQLWRNHLLGIGLLDLGELDQFHSVHMYPGGKSYQKEAVEIYQSRIQPDYQQYFIPLTFEHFTNVAEKVLTTRESLAWIDYLKSRY
jgi:hypothetical protein